MLKNVIKLSPKCCLAANVDGCIGNLDAYRLEALLQFHNISLFHNNTVLLKLLMMLFACYLLFFSISV